MTKTVRFNTDKNVIKIIPLLGRRKYPKQRRRCPLWTSIEGVSHHHCPIILMVANHGTIKFRPVGRPAAYQFFRPKSYQIHLKQLVLRDIHDHDYTFTVTHLPSRILLTSFIPRRIESVPPVGRVPVLNDTVYDIVSWNEPILRFRKVRVWPRLS